MVAMVTTSWMAAMGMTELTLVKATTLSQAAMDWLHRKAETPAFRESPRKFIRRARARFPVGADHPPYRLWAPESDEAQDLEAAYARDWQAIRARWPDAVIAHGAAESSER